MYVRTYRILRIPGFVYIYILKEIISITIDGQDSLSDLHTSYIKYLIPSNYLFTYFISFSFSYQSNTIFPTNCRLSNPTAVRVRIKVIK